MTAEATTDGTRRPRPGVADLPRSTTFRMPSQLVRLHAELERIRSRHGLAIDEAERCTLRIAAVAAPVHGPDGVLGAISLAIPGPVPAHDLAPLVVLAARRATRGLDG